MDKNKILFCLKSLLFSYILTGVLLLLLALLLYKLQLSETIVSICIIGIYIAANFFSGFVTGKKMGSRKFLWGIGMGAAYFLVLSVLSLIVNQSFKEVASNFFMVAAICGGSGMLGGMVS